MEARRVRAGNSAKGAEVMEKINLDQAEAGMVLAQPLYDSLGRVLLNEGETLSTDSISRLAKMKVRILRVRSPAEEKPQEKEREQDNADQTPQQTSADQVIAEINEKVDARFADVMSNELMAPIAELAKKHLKAEAGIPV